MGHLFLDQYSLLHCAVGVVCYFFGISFSTSIIGHTLFEFAENTPHGIYFINNIWSRGPLPWPGGKLGPDSFTNVVGDTCAFTIGYAAAYGLDLMGRKNKWYGKNL